MSSRIDSPFGSLGERLQRSGSSPQPQPEPQAQLGSPSQPRTPWCLVDGVLPGVVAAWTRLGGEWQALVCYVKDGELHSAMLPARRLTPR